MPNISIFFLMLVGGAMVAIQPSVNARLAQKVGLIEGACISFAVGTLALLLLSLLTGRGNWKGVQDALWWEWTGGLFGAFFVTATILAVPRIGTAAAMAALIASQLTVGLVMDHYGLLGFRGAPLDFRRLAGVVLLLAGAALVYRR